MLGLETLPWGMGERANSSHVEPLQSPDSADASLEVLFESPVLAPGAPGIHPSTGSLPVIHQAAKPVSDGFRQTVDRPPRLVAQL